VGALRDLGCILGYLTGLTVPGLLLFPAVFARPD